MRVCLAYYVRDPAGSGIARALLEEHDHEAVALPGAVEAYTITHLDALLAGFDTDVLYLEFLDKVCDVEFYLILSRHSSEAGIKSLTVHHPGNPMREANAGGKPLELPPSNPILAKKLLLALRRTAGDLPGFSVTYEVTHHGPSSLRKPVTFVEIGSSRAEWSLKSAHTAVATAVAEALAGKEVISDYLVAVGIGGNHYAPVFTKRALEGDEAYGHMIANYALRSLEDPELVSKIVREACLKSCVPTQKVVAEKKLKRLWRDAVEKVAVDLGLQLEYV